MVRRRRFLRNAGVAVAVAAGGVGVGRVGLAAPLPSSTRTRLLFRPSNNGLNSPPLFDALNAALDPFRRRHPSLDVQLDWAANAWNGDPGGLAEAVLTGVAPDVMTAWRFAPLSTGDYFLDLTPYIRASNFDMSIFPPTLAASYNRDGKQLGLPWYNEWTTAMINQSMLDRLGLSYPEQSWTYLDAAKLYRAAAKPSSTPGKSIYGGQFWLYYSNIPDAMYFAPWGASLIDPTNPARAALDTPEMISAVTYMSDLVNEKACQVGGLGWSLFSKNQLAVAIGSDWLLPTIASSAPTLGFKFDFWPMPAGPRGGATYCSREYVAIPANTKNPDAAWELLQYIASEPYVARVDMEMLLYPPAQNSLDEEYLATVRRVAPPLRDKNLEAIYYWKTHAFQGCFANSNEQALSIISSYFAQIWSRQMAPEQALREAGRQVNALEAAGARIRAQEAVQGALISEVASARGALTLKAPAVQGVGQARTAATGSVVVRQDGAEAVLLGDGAALGGTSDNCIYFCTTDQTNRAAFVCRVTALANLTCPQLSPWAKAGLMVRGDLSDDAPMVLLAVTGGNGIVLEQRVAALLNSDEVAGNGAGLVPAAQLTANVAHKVKNYLLGPVWLKLMRDDLTWTAFSSFDGRTWTQAGGPVVVRMAAAWVGVACCAHNGDFGNKGYVRATFDNMSFRPSAAYQLGAVGVPPSAGAVPSNWAG